MTTQMFVQNISNVMYNLSLYYLGGIQSDILRILKGRGTSSDKKNFILIIYTNVYSSLCDAETYNRIFRMHQIDELNWLNMPKFALWWFLPFCLLHHKLSKQVRKDNTIYSEKVCEKKHQPSESLKGGWGNYAHNSLHYSIQNFLQFLCIMLQISCIILKIIIKIIV